MTNFIKGHSMGKPAEILYNDITYMIRSSETPTKTIIAGKEIGCIVDRDILTVANEIKEKGVKLVDLPNFDASLPFAGEFIVNFSDHIIGLKSPLITLITHFLKLDTLHEKMYDFVMKGIINLIRTKGKKDTMFVNPKNVQCLEISDEMLDPCIRFDKFTSLSVVGMSMKALSQKLNVDEKKVYSRRRQKPSWNPQL